MANLQVEFKGNGITKIWSKQYVFDCFIVPRTSVASTIPDFDNKMAVYFLADTMEGRREKRKLYAGKTSTGMTRFFNHRSQKDWWDKVFIFTAPDKYFTEDTILGLENLFITKYKNSGLYVMEQEGSNRKYDDDCEYYAEQIMNIMDFLGYPEYAEYHEKDESASSLKANSSIQPSEISVAFDTRIKAISPHIKSDQLKLYTTYKFEDKGICAVWIKNYGLELELYIKQKNILAQNINTYDISNRKRGLRETGFKVCSMDDLEKAFIIISQIIKEL